MINHTMKNDPAVTPDLCSLQLQDYTVLVFLHYYFNNIRIIFLIPLQSSNFYAYLNLEIMSADEIFSLSELSHWRV